MAPKKPITITDLSLQLGLAKSTVSKALRDNPEISKRTIARVKEYAERVGYQPSSLARAIRTGRAHSVGLVLRTKGSNSHKPFLSTFVDGISSRLSENHYTLTIATADTEEGVVERHAELIARKAVDGFVIPRTRPQDRRIALLLDAEVPFTLFGRTGEDAYYSWYDIDQKLCYREAVRHLHTLGHRSIAYLGGDPEYYYETLRSSGFNEAARELADLKTHVVDGCIEPEDGEKQVRALLALDCPPTAFVCALDRVGLGCIRQTRLYGLCPGRDISVVGYEMTPEGQYAEPPLSSFFVDTYAAGYRIADFLMQQFNGIPAKDLQQLVKAVPTWRGTDGPPTYSPAELADHLKNNM